MNIYERILDNNSLTSIGYKAEDELVKREHTADECLALKAIMETNSLDEVWAICYEQLGMIPQANTLRAWIARDKPKVDFDYLNL